MYVFIGEDIEGGEQVNAERQNRFMRTNRNGGVTEMAKIIDNSDGNNWCTEKQRIIKSNINIVVTILMYS